MKLVQFLYCKCTILFPSPLVMSKYQYHVGRHIETVWLSWCLSNFHHCLGHLLVIASDDFFKNWDTISLHKIITILKCTVQWHLVQPPPLPSLITLSSTLKKTLSPAVTPHLSLAAINVFLSLWIYLVLEVSHLWNQTMCGLLCLTFFTGCVLEVHPYCSMCQFFIPFYGWVNIPLET